MRLKPGVSLKGISPELCIGLMVAMHIYAKHGHTLTVTSVSDGKHKQGSLHYRGRAADLRIRDLQMGIIEQVIKDLTNALSDEFDVVLESDHIHLEFHPKG